MHPHIVSMLIPIKLQKRPQSLWDIYGLVTTRLEHSGCLKNCETLRVGPLKKIGYHKDPMNLVRIW